MDTFALDFRHITPRTEALGAEKLRIPPVGDRFRPQARREELDHLAEIPLLVLHLVAEDTYYIVRNATIFFTGSERGLQKFTCEVIGEIENEDQAIWARFLHVIDRRRPFHILEEARCIHDASEKLREHFGPDSFFTHGGNRRGADWEKLSMADVLRTRIPAAISRIGTLLRLVDHLGPWGLEGLYLLLKAERKSLAIGRINKRNGYLDEIMIRSKIEDAVQDFENQGRSRREKLSRAATMAFDAIFEEIPEEKLPVVRDDKDGGNGGDAEDEPDPDDFQMIPAKARAEIAGIYAKLWKSVTEKTSLWEKPGDMPPEEVRDAYKWTQKVMTFWTEFNELFLKYGQTRPSKTID